MCHDRGYLVTQDELDQTVEQFKEQFGERPRLLLLTQNQIINGSLLILYFYFSFSEGRPSRGDLSVLVEHNDDPSGTLCHSFVVKVSTCGFFQDFFRIVKQPTKVNLKISFSSSIPPPPPPPPTHKFSH